MEYKPGQKHGNADILSRLPLPESPTDVPVLSETFLVLDMLVSLPVTIKQIRQWTTHDLILSQVRIIIQQGWNDTNDTDLRPFQNHRNELSLNDMIKRELNEGHPGPT